MNTAGKREESTPYWNKCIPPMIPTPLLTKVVRLKYVV